MSETDQMTPEMIQDLAKAAATLPSQVPGALPGQSPGTDLAPKLDADPIVDHLPAFSAESMKVLRSVSTALYNFEGSDLEKWKLSSLAEGASCQDGADWIDKPINLRWWYLHEVEIYNEEQDATAIVLRVVLFDEDSTPIGFASDGVAKGVLKLAQIFGRKKIDPPVPVVVKELKTRKGRRYYVLEAAGL